MKLTPLNQRVLKVVLLLTSTVVLDQLSKLLARQSLDPTQPIDLLGGFVHFEWVENSGAFLSFGSTWLESIRFYIFTGAVGIFLVWGIYYLIRKDLDFWNFIGMNLLIGGGIGNLIDRASKGAVTDFVLLKLGPLHTGVFNVADMFILAGVIILFLFSKNSGNKDISTHHS
jgi:signal peptidase II